MISYPSAGVGSARARYLDKLRAAVDSVNPAKTPLGLKLGRAAFIVKSSWPDQAPQRTGPLPEPASQTKAPEQFVRRQSVVTNHGDHFRLLKLGLLVKPIGRHLHADINAKVELVTVEGHKF
jgi:hypothetical protein